MEFDRLLQEGALISFILVALKNVFKNQIKYFFTALAFYLRRPYDRDRDPKSPDRCQIFNPGNGKYETVYIRHHFSLRRHENGVYVHWPIKRAEDDSEYLYSTARVPFDQWADWRKRGPPKTYNNPFKYKTIR